MRNLNFISLAVKAEQNFTSFEAPAEMKSGSGHPYLKVLTEQVWKMNDIFRSPGRAEVWKGELQIFGSQGRAEVRKRNFTSLEVPAEMKCGSGITHIWKSWPEQVRKMNAIFEVLAERKYGKRNFRSLAVKTEMNCGSKASDL